MRDPVDLYHVSADLIRAFDDKIGAAKAKVVADENLTESVTLAVKVGRDKDGEIIILFDDKGNYSRKTSILYQPGQIELDLMG